MTPEGDDEPEQVINKMEVVRVGDAFGFDDEETLERMNNFLNLLPLVWVLS